ncbi:stalk domain-containing protein [Paenibacillus sp. JX-17]|uniref:Stalk domain-containing protein n=1 Tax=Paenibacillus lacisoli TaxID=3064525 RepID=A0ABT9CBF1_9BACL|nr:stalk domain-containing protein [Paenibacillus sp. JX-17]MDO7906587.1 stalk domain-containing protein [Paenibacillus sp. JX-17]
MKGILHKTISWCFTVGLAGALLTSGLVLPAEHAAASSSSAQTKTTAQVKPLSGIVSLTAAPGSWGGTVYAVDKDGHVWTWGSNAEGQFGTGRATVYAASISPYRIKGLEQVKQVAVSTGSLALRQDGSVWTWGGPLPGNQANHTEGSSRKPVQVKGVRDVVQVEAGYYAYYALQKDGTVWAWQNDSARLENTTLSDTPRQIQGLDQVTSIADLGAEGMLALKKDGTVSEYQFHFKTVNGKWELTTALQIVPSARQIKSLSRHGSYMILQGQNGQYYRWNTMPGEERLQKQSAMVGQLRADVYGTYYSLTEDGIVWTWKRKLKADGTAYGTTRPVKEPLLKGAVDIQQGEAAAYALMPDGTVRSWGTNLFGRLGIGEDGGYRLKPTAVGRSIELLVRGQDPDSMAAPIMEQGKVWVPLRQTAEALGAKIGYSNGAITMTMNGKTKTINGDHIINEDGSRLAMPNMKRVWNVQLISAATLAELTGSKVTWDGVQNRISFQ